MAIFTITCTTSISKFLIQWALSRCLDLFCSRLVQGDDEDEDDDVDDESKRRRKRRRRYGNDEDREFRELEEQFGPQEELQVGLFCRAFEAHCRSKLARYQKLASDESCCISHLSLSLKSSKALNLFMPLYLLCDYIFLMKNYHQ